MEGSELYEREKLVHLKELNFPCCIILRAKSVRHRGKNRKLCTLLGKVGFASGCNYWGEKPERVFYTVNVHANGM